ncbi:MAG TPA: M20/M25/M40 family metallo-hydrolase [Xanthomonadales bacterium]|nr:M20/M25/M40 family metallo-hydrolase [Xanthomonadales bacterium]
MINKKRLVKTFLDLVTIDSPSGEEKKVSIFVSGILKKLGGEVEFDSYGNIIAKFKGRGEPIMLNSHLDTVEPGRGINPHVLADKITSDGTTILGGDAKAGVATIIEALTSLKEKGMEHKPIDVVFTVEEETGLFGAINLDYDLLEAKHGVTLDGHSSVKDFTISAPGYIRVDATIVGRSAHSGYEPEKGLSAIRIASEIITRLQEGRIDHETTANIGTIEGGSVRNAVPETVHLKGEIRSRNLKKLEKHKEHFEKVFREVMGKYPESKLDLNLFKEFDPYVFDGSQKIIKLATEALKKIGREPTLAPSGGGTDVNIFHTKGIEALCVGAGYYEAHTTREYVVISEMLEGASFCEEIVSNK